MCGFHGKVLAMSLRRSHHILVLLLVMLMTSVSAWTSGAAGLVHQLEHAFAGAAAADAPHHHHAQQLEQHNDPADAGSTAGAEHQMLHAVDHLQFFHGSGVQARMALKTTDADPLRFVDQPLPLASIDPPFRPPRSTLLAA